MNMERKSIKANASGRTKKKHSHSKHFREFRKACVEGVAIRCGSWYLQGEWAGMAVFILLAGCEYELLWLLLPFVVFLGFHYLHNYCSKLVAHLNLTATVLKVFYI